MSTSRWVFLPKIEEGMSGPPKNTAPSAFCTSASNSGVQALRRNSSGSLMAADTAWNLNQSSPASRAKRCAWAKSSFWRTW